jgi:IS30 family transposase
MKKYRQLTYEDRVYIDVLNFQRKSRREIADSLRVNRSTITREFQRGCSSKGGWGHCYRAELAEKAKRMAAARRGRPSKIHGELEKYITERLKLKWSPEQISGRLTLEGKTKISYETIYGFIKRDRDEGGQLYLNLRHGRRRRKKRFSIPRIRADILNRKKIEDRPVVINKRERIGDWERDLVFGNSKRAAILTAVDRKSLLTVIRKVENKSPSEISRVTAEIFGSGIFACHSITNDNGFEFRFHERESLTLGVPIYFTNPYSSWEKGTNENTNGLIRQYFTHQTNMEEFTNENAKEIEEALNTRPRKKLGFRTPKEFTTQSKVA